MYIGKMKLKNTGQLLLSMGLIVAMLTSAMLLWNYNHIIIKQTTAGTAENLALTIGQTMLTRLKAVISSEYTTSSSGSEIAQPASCPDIGKVLRDFSQFDNTLSQPAHAKWEQFLEITNTYNKTTSAWSTPNSDSTWLENCILTKDEASQLEYYFIKVEASGPSNFYALSRPIKIKIITRARTNVEGQSTSVNQVIARNYTLKVAQPIDFNVMIFHDPNTRAFQPASGNTAILAVDGYVYVESETNANIDFDNIMPASNIISSRPNVVFNRPVYFKTTNITNTTAPSLNQNSTHTLKSSFIQGFETGVFNHSRLSRKNILSETIYSLNSGNLISGRPAECAHNIKLDYYNAALSGDNSMPLPNLLNNSTGCITGKTSRQHEATKAKYQPSRGNINVFPDANAGLTEMHHTCFPENHATNENGRTFVFNRKTEEITLNFTNSEWKNHFFCGIILAKRIHIVATPGSISNLFGFFGAESIDVTGENAEIYFHNPKDNYNFLANTFNGMQTQEALYAQFVKHSGDIAHNFFIPLMISEYNQSNLDFFIMDPVAVSLTSNINSTEYGYMKADSNSVDNLQSLTSNGTGFIWKNDPKPINFPCFFGTRPADPQMNDPGCVSSTTLTNLASHLKGSNLDQSIEYILMETQQ